MVDKGQSTLIGFLALIAIGLAVITAVYVWAWPNIQKAQNQDEVFRLENRMIELHNAIKKAASEQGFLTVPFTIKKGTLYLDDNNSIVFKGNFKLPQAYQEQTVIGNKTEPGILGKDEPGYLIKRGSVEFMLHYVALNYTATGKCYGIKLKSGDQAAAGRGDHNIFVKWVEENASAIMNGCNTTQEIVSIHIE